MYRYKLAAAVCRDAGTQTTPADRHTEPQEEDAKQTGTSQDVPLDFLDILETAKRDILKLQREKEVGTHMSFCWPCMLTK